MHMNFPTLPQIPISIIPGTTLTRQWIEYKEAQRARRARCNANVTASSVTLGLSIASMARPVAVAANGSS